MRASLLLLAVLAVLASSQASSISEVLVKEQWEAWKAKNGKEYQNHEEERFRMKIWMDNMEKMEKHNEQYYQGEVKGLKRFNKFSDLLESEIEAASAGDNIVGWSALSLDTCSSNCIFPFKYKGTTYTKCTKARATYNWCATAVNIGSSSTPDYYGHSWYAKCASDCPAARMDEEEEEEETAAKLTDEEDTDVEAFNLTSPCGTEDGKQCIFPFYYSGKTYTSCTAHYSSSNKAWCATKTTLYGDSGRNQLYSRGSWGHCNSDCPGYSEEDREEPLE